MRVNTKAAALIIVLVMAVLTLTGCARGARKASVLLDTETLYIEQQGTETRVYDRAGGAAYTYTTHRTRKETGTAARITEAATKTETETITIQTAHGLIIVSDKTTGQTFYIKGGRP